MGAAWNDGPPLNNARAVGLLMRTWKAVDRLKVATPRRMSTQERVGWQSAVRAAKFEIAKITRDFDEDAARSMR